MALPIQAVIHELSEEVMNFNQLTSFDLDVPQEMFEPWDDWENEFAKITTGKCSLFLCILNERSALWSSIVTNLSKFYFF